MRWASRASQAQEHSPMAQTPGGEGVVPSLTSFEQASEVPEFSDTHGSL